MKPLLVGALIGGMMAGAAGLVEMAHRTQATPPPKPTPQAVAPTKTRTPTPPATSGPVIAGKYVLIGYNDLGMHCISPRFAEMAILPPANNLWAVVIERGAEPRMVTSGVTISYAFPQNTTVVGKSDFWANAPKLFGKNLPVGTGLTGNSLAGNMKVVGDHFEATALPLLPYNDDHTWNPYQQAVLTLKDNTGKVLATANVVVPVSDELNCQKCHATGGVAAKGISTPTLEGNILTLHDKRHATNLMASRPVLCSSCHADPALGMAGKAGVESLSLAMHNKHSSVSVKPACADCHPGPKTQCNRSAIQGMGPEGTDPKCEQCHGDLTAVAQSLQKGRQPWAQEPKCAQCHNTAGVDTGTTLYRNAKGHGGVYCETCRNSPHAWYPSLKAADNAQPQALQHSTKAIGATACYVCHTDGRTGTQPPHGGDDGGGGSGD